GGAGLLDLPEQRIEVVGHRLLDLDVAAGDGGGEGEGARLDPVGDDAVLRAAQLAHAIDLHAVRAGAGDARAHRVEHGGEVLDLRLAGGVDDRRAAFGEGGGEHDVQRAHDAGVIEYDVRAAQRRFGAHVERVAALGDGGAEHAEAGEVHVERPDADGVAAGRRARRHAEARD